MRQLSSKIWEYLRSRTFHHQQKKKLPARLRLEVLEDRCVPTGNASGVVTGLAFIDGNGNGVADAGDALIPGTPVHLVGTTSQGTAINVAATTAVSGRYTFDNVLPGDYHIQATPPAGVIGGSAVTLGTFSVAGGQTITRNIQLRGGLDPTLITLRQFLTESTDSSVPIAPGSGEGLGNYRPNNNPTVKTAIADITVSKNAADTLINLAGRFTDPDFTDSQVTFNITNNGVARTLKVELFDTLAPQTVANFFDYLSAGEYDNSIFHRLATSFVLQGGALKLANTAGTDLVDVPVHNLKVPNEFLTSNTLGTLAMAQSGGDPNSATNQFFFNVVNNASSLDSQLFTVFGRLLDSASLTALNALAATPTQDMSGTSFATAHPTALLNQVPLNNYTGTTFPTDAVATNYMVINSITIDKRDEFLTYSIVSNSNPSLVTATLDASANELLKLEYAANAEGTATITIRATDRYGATVDETFEVNVSNQAPSATVTIAPQAPAPTATLTATAVGADPDGDAVTFTYQWSVAGTVVQSTAPTSSTTDTFDLSAFGPFNPGDEITVTVTPNDGVVDGAPATASVNINTPPEFDADNLLAPTAPGRNGTVTVSVSASDADGDDVLFTYVWEVNNIVVQTTTNSSSDSNTLDLSTVAGVNPGDPIVVTITPTDGKTAGTPTDAATTVNFPPVVGQVTLEPAGPNNNETLTATVPTPTDNENDPVTLTYVWTVNGATVKTTSNTTSLTDTLDLATVTADTGDLIEVTVTPNDGKDDGAATSADVTVGNSAAVFDSATLAPLAPTDQDTLTVTVSASDFDTDPITFTYEWTVNGVSVQTTPDTTATSDLFDLSTLSGLNPGDPIVVTITASDGKTTSAATVLTTAINQAPVVNSVTIAPDDPSNIATLTATVDAADPDSDPLTFTYVWTVNATPVQTTSAVSSTSDTLDLSALTIATGDLVSVSVTPNDGKIDGAAFVADTTIANSVPVIDAVTLTPADPSNRDILTAEVFGATDPDADSISFTYVFSINGTATQTTTTTSTTEFFNLAGRGIVTGDLITVAVTPNDGKNDGVAQGDSVTVANSAPVVTDVAITPDNPDDVATLTALPTADDPDLDLVTFAYQWLQNGVPIDGATSDVLDLTTLAQVDVGDTFAVEVTPNDGITDGPIFTSDPVTIATVAPITLV